MPLTDYLLLIIIAATQIRPIKSPTVFLTKRSITCSPSLEILIHTGSLAAITTLASTAILIIHSIISTYPNTLTILKITGASYLTWFSIREITAKTSTHKNNKQTIAYGQFTTLWTRSFTSEIRNTRTLLFFSSLLTQFIDSPDNYQISNLAQLTLTFIIVQTLALTPLTPPRRTSKHRTIKNTLNSLKKIASAALIIFFWSNISFSTHNSTADISSASIQTRL